MRITIEQAREIARRAARRAGANEAAATSLANATVAAEISGRDSVGFAHLPDYLAGFAAGRIAGTAQPGIAFPTPATIRVDAHGGIAQLGFDLAFDELRTRAALYGVAMFAQTNSYTAGELGYYTRRLAEAGLVAFAVSNGPALVTAGTSRSAVYGTNPLSFAAPVADGPALVIDQASSATAFVNIRRAASEGGTIPEGWAIDAAGAPTTDARQAMKGLLLAFGGTRGANIALMAEVMAAGLTGANWSCDAPSFADGNATPGVGLFILAIAPAVLAPDFPARLVQQIARLAAAGIHIPGRREITEEAKQQLELPAEFTPDEDA
ncbi:Ldh family oxidoreductase [Bradyrhizobium sp. U87765 SZCCT0131]|uniref:Ldh family oxidoreductase n=1 Tax=unclassified Bradyrhizobium TaxID=2631580 RepID=UPI001BA94BCA|nr:MULTISPECIES: Ldh family oxidoreductase [unclassified Bradyrhizobium]MBR1219112.1 Ldh family oxidoreductase [Bradyrhizobium sp. U87765 SZCCT0131]MBR1261763.1 Ldh family oxidoreductase [Bradyrhizobium sp. U87765 SZCCT0134]MBR1306384.1 Ldh family oxidoreductase [Bradyrhizobium sp. U87765 SZCCT0110]MBR1317545.1 Ldh family oxidoreductase [Bradyrhizobium sp. U87765 SZCCT0109]MBR1351247.1 Ldh family oxidoreductase [Bradyrhizobium sp. U87765 SZCCT0048]